MKLRNFKWFTEIKRNNKKINFKILDVSKKEVCKISFDKEFVENVGNRYEKEYPYCIKKDILDIEDILFGVLLEIQNGMNLAETKKKKINEI